MLKFIVCEDNEIIRKKNISVINKVMFSNNVNYNIFDSLCKLCYNICV